MNLKPIHIEATTLSDAWFQTVYKCLEIGQMFKIDQGSYEGDKRLEFDYITIHVKRPFDEPILPKLPAHYSIPDPVDPDYINEYLPYLMTAEEKKGEAYTYGSRLTEVKINLQSYQYIEDNSELYKKNILDQILNNSKWIDQVKNYIDEYKNHGQRSNQRVLQIAQPNDCILKDPPCLRHIDTRIQDNKLHFFPYFRSWDLWGGFPANLQAIQYLKKYMADEIGVEDGEMICASKGLHLYSYVWELAELIRGKTIEEFRRENEGSLS
jgi:thymidylate synthase